MALDVLFRFGFGTVVQVTRNGEPNMKLHQPNGSKTVLTAPLLVALLSALIGLWLLAAYLTALEDWRDVGGLLVGRDFVNLHFAGRLLAEGRMDVLFNEDAYVAALRDLLGQDYDPHNWSYPPLAFPMAEAVSKLPYLTAYAVWVVLSAALLCTAARLAGMTWAWAVLLVLSPAAILCVLLGQNGVLNAALILFAFAAAARGRTPGAALAWTLLSYKMHMGLMTLPTLLGQRKYGVILLSAIGVALFVGLTAWRYGFDAWHDFVTITAPQQTRTMQTWTGFVEALMPTFFMIGRIAGAGIPGAYYVYLGGAVVAVLLLVRAWPGRGGEMRDWLTWYTLGTLVLLPYMHIYDTVILHVILILWANEREALFLNARKSTTAALWALVWLMPMLSIASVSVFRVQPLPFLVLFMLFAFGSYQHARRTA